MKKKKEKKSVRKIQKKNAGIAFKPIEWKPSMSVEEPTIDAQHKKLVAGINQLHAVAVPGKELSKVREGIHFAEDYVREHFSYEQEYMEKINFPGLNKHIRIHEKFIEFFNDFKKDLDRTISSKDTLVSYAVSALLEKCRKYMANWLQNHMLKEDQKYHKYAKKQHLIGKKLADLKKNTGDKKSNSLSKIAQSIKNALINKQRNVIQPLIKKELTPKSEGVKDYVFTGISGFDGLFEKGIPRGNLMIVAGGAGSGKTIFCLQTLVNKAREGKKCLYMTLEEEENKLVQHMEDFGWNAKELIKKGKLKIHRMNPFDITRNVDALLAKQKGELLIDIEPVILPKDFKNPDFIVIDSLTAIASAFTGRDESYRVYIEQLFRFLEKSKSTCFLITETEQVPKIYSPTGVEEFLADGVIVLYAIKHGNVRENAIEVLKLRGAAHQKKIVAMQIGSDGIVVYPEQEIFSDI